MNKNILSMSFANALGLLAAIGGYLVYSRLLDVGQMAIYAGALALARFGSLLLDAGLKVALVTQEIIPSKLDYLHAYLISIFLSILGSLVISICLGVAYNLEQLSLSDTLFLGLFAASYIWTYPFQLVPLAHLERSLKFNLIARAEGIGIVIEYGLPALLWLIVSPTLTVFVIGVWVGRIYRTVCFRAITEKNYSIFEFELDNFEELRRLIKIGLNYQAASLASLFRDNLHFIVIGPLYGKEWVGLYSWVLQMCAAFSQLFVQAASRVTLPWLRSTDKPTLKSSLVLTQIKLLTIFTFPPMVLLIFIAPIINTLLYAEKWINALVLLPFLVLRMLPGISTTIIGSLVMTEIGSKSYFKMSFYWTISEIFLLALILPLFGAHSLAIVYSISVWLGLWLLFLPVKYMLDSIEILKTMLFRPSTGFSVFFMVIGLAIENYGLSRFSLVGALLYVCVSYFICLLSEPIVRKFLIEHVGNVSKKNV